MIDHALFETTPNIWFSLNMFVLSFSNLYATLANTLVCVNEPIQFFSDPKLPKVVKQSNAMITEAQKKNVSMQTPTMFLTIWTVDNPASSIMSFGMCCVTSKPMLKIASPESITKDLGCCLENFRPEGEGGLFSTCLPARYFL